MDISRSQDAAVSVNSNQANSLENERMREWFVFGRNDFAAYNERIRSRL
jgi:hypothetical protein